MIGVNNIQPSMGLGCLMAKRLRGLCFGDTFFTRASVGVAVCNSTVRSRVGAVGRGWVSCP